MKMNYEKISLKQIDEKRLIGTFVREKWKGIEFERGDGRGRVWCLAMNRRRERKCKVEVAVDILIYQIEREREIVTL